MVPGQSDPFHLGYWPTDVPQQEPQVQPATILLWHVELWFGNLSASLGFFSCRKLYCKLLQEWLQQLKVGILNDLQEWFQQHKQVIINNPTVSFAEKKYVFSLVKKKHIFWEKQSFFHNWRKPGFWKKKPTNLWVLDALGIYIYIIIIIWSKGRI